MTPRLAVTLGDPRGIGLEVTLAALAAGAHGDAELTFLGADEAAAHLPAGLDFRATGPAGSDDASAGRTAALAIEAAVDLALEGAVHGIVTAPIHKPSFHAAGWHVPGHTEMLQDRVGAEQVGMLMAAETTRLDAPLRVLLATTHLALRDVPAAVTAPLLVAQATLLAEALERDWNLPEPRLALCALNPHASDNGLFGDEEARTLGPAVQACREAGIDLTGPLPADTVFARALAGDFDAVVVPYHDVGMAAFKTVSFGTGVNVTLGLPFVRTSPDHGTAFEIAGTGRADASSMIEAVRLATSLARGRFDMDSGRV